MSAPDLGIAFHPKASQLKKYCREKAKIINYTLQKKGYKLIEPSTNDLENYLKRRMLEQGRFAGLSVKKNTSVFFIKFPLGGNTAKNASIREEKIYSFLYSIPHQLPIPQKASTFPTPYGYALSLEYIPGKRLEQISKTDKIHSISQILHSIQTCIEKSQNIPSEKENPYLYGVSTTPIHTFEDYEREVAERLEKYSKSKPYLITKKLQKRILKKIKELKLKIISFENIFVFSHRDFFDKNIIAGQNKFCKKSSSEKEKLKKTTNLYIVDFEHAAIIKNYILGLNFDLANIVVQWYRYPKIGNEIIKQTRALYEKKTKIFDVSLTACLIIQILAKIDPLAQTMTPGGVYENLSLLEETIL